MLSVLARGVFLSRLRRQPRHVRGGEEVKDHLSASLVGGEVPDLELVPTSSYLPPHLCPQDLLLALPVRTAQLKRYSRVWALYVRASPALSGG